MGAKKKGKGSDSLYQLLTLHHLSQVVPAWSHCAALKATEFCDQLLCVIKRGPAEILVLMHPAPLMYCHMLCILEQKSP